MKRVEDNHKSKYSLRSRIFFSFLLSLLPLLILLVISVEIFLLPSIRDSSIQELQRSTNYIKRAVKASVKIAVRNHLKAIAEKNLQIAKHHLLLVEQGLLDRQEAKKRLRSIILSQKVGTSGYLYCLNSEGTVVVHPHQGVENSNQADFYFIQEQIKRKNGYLEYAWQNPGEKSPRDKALYMLYFEPLDWIISASSYKSEFTQLVNPDDFKDLVLSMRFGDTGYAYVFNEQGETLVHPYLKNFNILKQDNIDSDFILTMLENKSGQLFYNWRNPQEKQEKRKIAVYESIPEFKWVVVSSAYIEEITNPIRAYRGFSYFAIALLIIAATITAFLLSGRISKPLQAMIEQLDFNRANQEQKPLPSCRIKELSRLSDEMNSYLQSLKIQRDELEEERQRYQNLFMASPDAVFLIREVEIIDCNPSTFEILRGERKDLIGKTVLELSPEFQADGRRSVDKSKELLAKVAQGELETFEWLHQRLDGEVFQAEVRLKFFAKVQEQRIFVAFLRDISDKKKAEESLRRERDFNQTLISSSPAYIIILNRNGCFELVNPAFCQALGYQANQLIGKNYFDTVIPEDQRDRIRNVMQSIYQAADNQRALVRVGTNPILSAENELRKVQWAGTWIVTEAMKEASLLAIGVDISEEEVLQEQLHHIQKLDAVGRLAGGVAHDFNNMLAGISGAAELLEMNCEENEKSHTYINMIMEIVEKAAELCSKLLVFSRKRKSVFSVLDLHKLLNDVLGIFQSGLVQDIKVEKSYQADNALINGDASQLQNAFLNLFINARDAMPEGGRLNVRTAEIQLRTLDCQKSPFQIFPGMFLEVQIEDNGTGMSPDLLHKIFEPFFTTKEEGKGTGLGLASVYSTIKEHQGEIKIESEVGKGSLFRLRIPLSKTRQLNQVDTEKLVKGNGTILLVDDDEVLRSTGSIMLEKLGYIVLSASDGLEALEIFKTQAQHIKLVILDMIMPGLNGRETFKALQELDPSVKIILASGFSDRKAVDEMLSAGLKGVLTKPFRLKEISSLIARVLGDSSK